MVSRNIVAKQEDGEGDWIVSRVRKVHHGDAPYDSKHPIVTVFRHPAYQKLPAGLDLGEVTDLWSGCRGSFYMNMLFSQSGGRFINRAQALLHGTEVTTSIRLCWDRWIPGCTSYTAAQWDCLWGIDLVDPAEPPLPLASLHSSELDATWRTGVGRSEAGQREMIEGEKIR